MNELEEAAPGLCLAAPAKINLWLHVLGRRSDGYHLLDSLVVFAGFGDHVEALPAERLSLEVEGPAAGGVPRAADNLVLRAARLLAEVAGVPAQARLRLHKRLPMAAGLGGGSADAAAALRALSRLWNAGLDESALRGIGAALGADVPVCLYGRPARVGGVGDEIAPAPALPGAWLLLVNPRLPLATAAVFQARRGPYSAPLPWPGEPLDLAGLVERLAAAGNDLEAPARQLCPAVDAVLSALAETAGCRLARMSGSGATCFGLFDGAESARRAAEAIAAAHPGWWLQAAPILAGRAD